MGRKKVKEVQKLTKEQVKLVEENENMIHWYIRKNSLSYDLYDVLSIALCKAAQLFDETKGFHFSTLVYKCFSSEVSREERKILATRRGSGEIPLSLDAEVYKGIDGMCNLLELLSDNRDFTKVIEEKIIVREAMEFLKEELNESDYKICCLWLQFLGQVEIARITGLSQSWVSRSIKRTKWLLRTKFRKEIEK